MDSRKITGLSMIIAPVVAILGWIGLGLVVLDGASPSDPSNGCLNSALTVKL